MDLEATAGSCPPPRWSWLRNLGRPLAAVVLRIAVTSTVIAVPLVAWIVRRDDLYTSSSNLGYWLGVAGGSLMLVLLIYPLRKRYRALAVLGPLRHWFRFHMFAGVAGPVIVLFHSTFRVGSFNAAIALASMLLVVASGVVGRVIYRRIHNGLYGSRATATELQRTLEQQLTSLRGALAGLPAVKREIDGYTALISRHPRGRWRRGLHFASLGLRRHLASRRVHSAIDACDAKVGAGDTATHEHLRALSKTIDDTLKAMQRSSQFSTFERLFSLWHIVHIPFLCLLVITAIVHVVAVHAY